MFVVGVDEHSRKQASVLLMFKELTMTLRKFLILRARNPIPKIERHNKLIEVP